MSHVGHKSKSPLPAARSRLGRGSASDTLQPDLTTEVLREMGREDIPGPRPGKYPLGNRLYHLAVMVAGLGAIGSGLLMMSRVRTPIFERNPYLMGDAAYGRLQRTA